jgi:hypothetical protein
MRKRRNSNRKIPNRIFAIVADAAAMPVNPNAPAISAIIKNMNAHLSIPLYRNNIGDWPYPKSKKPAGRILAGEALRTLKSH